MDQHKSLWGVVEPFVFGGLAGMAATVCIQPVDMVKVRIQLAGEGSKQTIRTNPFHLASTIIRQESLPTLYKGLSAGLLRQATYTTARMGLFNSFLSYFKSQNGPNQPVSFGQRAMAGLAAGGLGALVGTPADLALVRMQSDGTLPVEKRANYKGVGDALGRIARTEGVGALWNGAGPTVVRAMALNLGMLATYSEAKHQLEHHIGPSLTTTLGASAIAGFFASFLSLPFDFVKTRLQKQRPDAMGKLPYGGSLDCAAKVAKREGVGAFYKGFSVYYFRIAPHAMITLLIADGLNAVAKHYSS
ncbi:putative mitochondrial 2-oxoglutarate/malate carrier protein [Rhizophlyctis rosea]|uniref:Mitochondrial 2-oxoglutarate/malate carrier protein n=1 Tax=Rhizophlyctis rosea TaxID=64517 RepID=A0AAD5SH51_9FUNG|nr:putative mitochondrial 2-oxoglutarate/malate carrier protein [Rhizophlyctis rosea]